LRRSINAEEIVERFMSARRIFGQAQPELFGLDGEIPLGGEAREIRCTIMLIVRGFFRGLP
jgi:hypothetical protein